MLSQIADPARSGTCSPWPFSYVLPPGFDHRAFKSGSQVSVYSLRTKLDLVYIVVVNIARVATPCEIRIRDKPLLMCWLRDDDLPQV